MLCAKKICSVHRKYAPYTEIMACAEKLCSVHPIFAGFLEKEPGAVGNKIINKRLLTNAR
jgi:hypothetical protein